MLGQAGVHPRAPGRARTATCVANLVGLRAREGSLPAVSLPITALPGATMPDQVSFFGHLRHNQSWLSLTFAQLQKDTMLLCPGRRRRKQQSGDATTY